MNIDMTTTVTEEQLKAALIEVVSQDVEGLLEARRSYGDSWMRRGGVGAAMNLFRKTDRLELLLQRPPAGLAPYDLFAIILGTLEGGEDKLLDTVRDLRRYLALAEAHMTARGAELPKARDNKLAKGSGRRVVLEHAPPLATFIEPVPAVPFALRRAPVEQPAPFGFDKTDDLRPAQESAQDC